ncbi:MAG: PDZ domain-containing protein [Chlamydiia bacterium]|nr:PDZ domain-containing protein [Chlamydiia bacterium]
MGRAFLFRLIIFLSFSLLGFTSEAFTLSLKDVRPTMDKMFTYHVESKEFSPIIAKRSLKIYLEQFDPDRIYLLKSEAEVYLGVSSRKVRELINHYHQDQFPEYWNLNFMVQRSIQRAQKIRHQQIERLINEGERALKRSVPLYYSDYARDEEELKNRIYERLILEVKSHLRSRSDSSVSPQLIQKILNHRSKKTFAFEEEYLGETEHLLTLHMLKAMAKCLDAHTGYYSPREAYEIRTMLKKEFSGVGVVFREDYDGIYVTDLVPNGPASKSGNIQVGDLLVAVNYQGVEDLTFEQLLELMKGKAGSKVTLGVRRNEQMMHVDLIREKISMDDERIAFSYEPYGDGIIGKIDVPAFYDNGGKISVANDLREALRSLKAEGNLKGIVLDFRENSGGFLSQAVKVSSLFINGGLIVISKYADGEVSYARDVDGRQFFDGPVLILISKASASAAEIVAQALQDYGVALIVGDERSYGKGTMQFQTITDERAKAFFKVTVGRYYTASGRSPQIQGVQGDILVPTAFSPYNIGEKYLEFPLANDHLSGDVFHSLMNIKQGSYRDVARFTVPYLKPRETSWRQMLPTLIKNSRERIENNQNYQFFLKVGNGYRPNKSKGQSRNDLLKENYGVNDLQIQESVEILKDMIALDKIHN